MRGIDFLFDVRLEKLLNIELIWDAMALNVSRMKKEVCNGCVLDAHV